MLHKVHTDHLSVLSLKLCKPYKADLYLGRCVWGSCIVQLWFFTWVFVVCSMLWSSTFGGLLCIRLLVLLLLVVLLVSISRIPLNIHLDFFSLFLSLLIILRAGPWTFLPNYPCLMVVILSLPMCIALQGCVGSLLVSWVASSLVRGRWPAIFLIQSYDTMACLCWWYMTEILGSQMHFGRPFGLTWVPNVSLVPPIIYRQMANTSMTTIVLNRC